MTPERLAEHKRHAFEPSLCRCRGDALSGLLLCDYCEERGEGDGRSASVVEERLREAANEAVAILMNEYVPPRRALRAVDVLTDALAFIPATGNSVADPEDEADA